MRPIDRVLDKLKGVTRSGDQWAALCPAHDDSEQSLAVSVGGDGRVLLHCYAGCDFKTVARALELTERELHVPKNGSPLTIIELALSKRLPVKTLVQEYALEELEGNQGIAIPYLDENRKILFRRRRWKLTGKAHTYQPAGKSLMAYGLWRLKDAYKAGELVIVEGETDCWVLWHHGFCALGAPGAAALKTIDPGQFRTIRRLYIWQEHDQAGATFVEKIAAKLRWKKWDGDARLLRHEGYKDPGDWHVREGERFAAAFRAAMDTAPPLPAHLSVIGFGGFLPGEIAESLAPGCRTVEVEKAVEATEESATVVVEVVATAENSANGETQKKAEEVTDQGNGNSNSVASSPPTEPPAPPAPPAPPSPPTPAPTVTIPGPSPGYYALTDLGNSQRLIYRHGKDLRYCESWGKWMIWDGTLWSTSWQGMVTHRAGETVRSIYAEAAATDQPDLHAKLRAHADASESARSIQAMVHLARVNPTIKVDVPSIDADPWLLGCENVTVDLRTGIARPHSRNDLLTKKCSTVYDPEAKAPAWQSFLDTIFEGKPELVGYIQRLMGYCLTGSVQEQILPVFWGGGSNGKSTLLNAIARAIGTDYAMQAAPSLLMVKRYEGHPTELADLFGKRLVICAETSRSHRLNEALVKQLTGGESIRARRMREDLWEFQPSHKILLCTNHKPAIHDTEHAIWRRVKLVPFTVTIPDERQDKNLPDRLKAEVPGILAWCVRGCLEWQRNGLGQPSEVEVATKTYREQEDVVGDFLAGCCETGDSPSHRTWAKDLYDAFTHWAHDNGEPLISQKVFGGTLVARGIKKTRGTGGRYYWLNVRLVMALRSELLKDSEGKNLFPHATHAYTTQEQADSSNSSTVHSKNGAASHSDDSSIQSSGSLSDFDV